MPSIRRSFSPATMPSIRRSFFKKKNRNKSKSPLTTSGKSLNGSSNDDDRSTPPMITPIDPDGTSTSSHNSNDDEIYLSNDNTNQTSTAGGGDPTNNSASYEYEDDNDDDPPMTASQFKTQSDKEMNVKRGRSRLGRECTTKSRDGVPIITSSGSECFLPSAVSSKLNYATDGFYSKSKKTFGGKERPKVRPSAKNSAFGGAPRYDWMDIETTAAIKIQAAYRRLQIQNYLDEQNLSTPGMRNRRAQKQARYQSRMSRNVASADVPFPFNLCGIGLLFGDSTFEDERVVESLEKKKVEKMKKVHEREDVEKRKFRMRKKESQHLEEGIEVVESFEGEEEEEGENDTVVGQEQAREGRPERKGPGRRGLSLNMSKSRNMVSSPGRSVGSPSLSPGRSRGWSRSRSKKLGRNQNDFDGEDV